MQWFYFFEFIIMKIQTRTSLLFCLLVGLSTFIHSCRKTSSANIGPVDAGKTITQLIASINNGTFFDSLIHKSGLDTTLKGTGPFTVFVATDTAFEVAGWNSFVISNTPDSVLYHMATYAIVDGLALGSANLPQGPDSKVITAGGDSIYITNNQTGIYVNGIPVTQPDVTASNGIINALLQPLIPPSGTLLQTLQSDTAFSFMTAAISRVSQGTTNLASILTGSPFTIFVPTNSAFQAAGFQTINDINAANPDSLAKIITYHIVQQREFSSDFAQLPNPVTLNGLTFEIQLGTNQGILGIGDVTLVSFVKTNILASNGVIHVISGVLTP